MTEPTGVPMLPGAVEAPQKEPREPAETKGKPIPLKLREERPVRAEFVPREREPTSRYANTALAIDAIVAAKDKRLEELSDDVAEIKKMETLNWSNLLTIVEIASKWAGHVGLAVEPTAPDLIMRPVTFGPTQIAPSEEGEEGKEGVAKQGLPPMLVTMKAEPLVTELKVSDIANYGTIAEAMRIIVQEMDAVKKMAYREWVVSSLSEGYAKTDGIMNVQLELVKRSGKIANAIESAYGALLKAMLAALPRVESFYYTGPSGMMYRGRAITPITPGEAERALQGARTW